jgi:hypothetical protein
MKWQGAARRPCFPAWVHLIGYYAYRVVTEALSVVGIAVGVALLVAVCALALRGIGINWAALD